MRLRLILSFTLVVLVSIGSVVLIARQGAAQEVRSFMFRGGMTGAGGLAGQLEAFYRENGSWDGVASLLNDPLQNRGQGRGAAGQGMGAMSMMEQRFRLADPDGNLVADTAEPSPSGSLPRSQLDVALPLSVNGKIVGYLLAEGSMAFSRADETFLVNRITQSALMAGLIAGGLSLLLALYLAYRLLRPIRNLTLASLMLAKGDLGQRVPEQGTDELASLAKTFNQMAASLQRVEESRRALTADIAHELRTPLAVQRAQLEALQDGIYPMTEENLAPLGEQNRLLTRLVEDLGTLALVDAGQLTLEMTPTDLPALLSRVEARFQTQAAARQLALSLEQPESCRLLNVDPQRIEQILNNLLSNALRHTPPAGYIKLTLRCTPEQAVLTVQDNGPGIPPEALPHVFERFYRADKSRSRSGGGSGLGLAIARQLARAHGGELVAANQPHGGAIFTLTLPVIYSS